MAIPNTAPIIVKRVVDDGHDGHHGGAWKVAYADFMTAMMAFFLLMWILSATEEETRHGLADYFSPASTQTNGPGGFGLLAGTSDATLGTLSAERTPVTSDGKQGDAYAEGHSSDANQTQVQAAQDTWAGLAKSAAQQMAANSASAPVSADDPEPSAEQLAKAAAERRAEDEAKFAELAQKMQEQITNSPELKGLSENVRFERTTDGLLVQIIDRNGKSMFASGSARPGQETEMLMEKLGAAIAALPNQMIIAGHTDAVPYTGSRDYSNWELSSDRANATRRVFMAAGVDPRRIVRISGLADTEPLNAADPRDPTNRRITVHLIYRDRAVGGEEDLPVGASAETKSADVL
ncbi:flagellar motor protein MotB [Frigidibacter sp. MR17.14]|uniref:flagellar motor protein MotB n=1 Tax=Frigidibacter sp. MR17.14 TaxID=3126509 RepID=UPI003012E5A0